MKINNKKKILIVTDFYKPHISGIVTSIDLFINYLRRKKFEITILTGDFSKNLKEIEYYDDVKVIRSKISFEFSRGFYSIDLIKKFLKESKKNDLINIHFPLAEIFPLIFFTNKKIILNYHCIPSYKSFFPKLITFYFYFFGMISMIISKRIIVFTKDYFFNIFFHKIYKNKISEVFPYFKNNFKVNLEKKEINIQSLQMGFIGRLSEEKGLENLLKASEILNKKKIKHNLIIAGDLEDYRFSNYINFLKKKSKNNDSVKFIGKVNETHKKKFFSQIDVLILPSINSFEAFGLVQLEAMSYGVPVIASNLKGVRMPVNLTKNGYIFHKKDVNQLVDSIVKFLQNREEFNSDIIKKRYSKIFNEENFEKECNKIFN